MKVHYISLIEALPEGSQGEILKESVIDSIQTLIAEEIAQFSALDLLALDFEEITLVKLASAETLILWLAQQTYLGAVFFVNLNEEIAFQFTNELGLSGKSLSTTQCWAFMDKSGVITWIGLRDASSSEKFSALVFGRSLHALEFSSDTRAQLESLPQLFAIQTENHSYCRSALLSDMFAVMEDRHCRRLAASLEDADVKLAGHFKLPSGQHSRTLFQSGLLLSHKTILSRISMEITRRVRGLDIEAIVFNTLVGGVLSRDVASLLGTSPRVIEATGWACPLG